METLFNDLRANKLQWIPELGMGWYPVTDQPYDAAYWERYRAMDSSLSGELLTKMRVELVRKYQTMSLVDIGIGGGRFVLEASRITDASGFDINPTAIDWLNESGLWRDPKHLEQIEALTFWDSLEHIHNPAELLGKVHGHVFVSLPVFDDAEHVLRSKHFRRDEHCWYFTTGGFIGFMDRFGFDFIERNTMEQDAGREGIDTFVFKRRLA